MNFEKVFAYSFRCYVSFEHKSVKLDLLKDGKIDFGYNENFRKIQKVDSSFKECILYDYDRKGLNLTINKFATYKEVYYGGKERYRQRNIHGKLLNNSKNKDIFFETSLPNLYSPIKGVVEKFDYDDEGNNNYFVNALIIKDELDYRHIFRYFYANIYPKNNAICEGKKIEIGDFLGFLAYNHKCNPKSIDHEKGNTHILFFKYIIHDKDGNFLNPITFWQWDRVEHYEVFNAQSNAIESEIIYYLNSDNKIIEIAYKKSDSAYYERFFPHLHLHHFFKSIAYTHRYNHFTQDIYPYKLLHNGELEKIEQADYPLFNDKQQGIIGLNTNPNDKEILLDCVFYLNHQALKDSIVYIYNTDNKQIYKTPPTNDNGEAKFTIKKENPHSNTLLYFSLNPNDFFDIYFASCRSIQITPDNKKQNAINIALKLHQTSTNPLTFKLKDPTINTTAKQWEIDRNNKLDSTRIISVINRGGEELFKLKDINKLHLIEPNAILALKLSHINEIQWFSKNALNYYELLPTSNLNSKKQCQSLKIHYDTWESLGDFIESTKPKQEDTQTEMAFMFYAKMYERKGKGDWKQGKNFITSMEGKPFWSDALGQLPFAINVYRGFLALLKQTTDLSQDEIAIKAKNATINLGYVFSEGDIGAILEFIYKCLGFSLEFHSSLFKKEQYPPLDYQSYDNNMILRGIAWVDLYNKKECYCELAKELENEVNLNDSNAVLANDELPPNVIRIETKDDSNEFIEIILPEEEEKSLLEEGIEILDKLGNIPLAITKIFKLPRLARGIYINL